MGGGELDVYYILVIKLKHKVWNMDPRPLGPKDIDGLLLPPGKAYTLLTDHLITC